VDFNLKFDEKVNSTSIVGPNGVGKTNIFEAIVHIFLYIQNLSDKMDSNKKQKGEKIFSFRINYLINDLSIFADNDRVEVDGIKFSYEKIPFSIIPNYIIIYNSGDAKRIYDLTYNFHGNINADFTILNLEYDIQKKLVLDYLLQNVNSLKVKNITMYLQPSKLANFSESNRNNKMGNFDRIKKFINYITEDHLLEMNKTLEVSFEQNRISEFQNIAGDVFNFLQELSSIDAFSSFSKSRRDYFKVLIGEKRIEFSNFGEGTQLMLSLESAFWKYGNKETLFLLDEPDAFIYPKNLDKLLNFFRDSTNQIILNTHSPLLVSRLKNSSTIILSDGITQNSKGYYGRKINFLYQDLMDIEDSPQDIKEIIKTINENIETMNLKSAREELGSLRTILGNDDTDVVSLETRINIKEYLGND
jgi:predicted ATPase